MGANTREGTYSIRSRVGLLAAALVIVATACGCQQTTPAAEGPWAADIEQARSEWASNEGSSPVEWCNRFVSFGLGYALSWSGVSSCWVGCGVSRDLVRMSRLR